jgi:hypothetical protein
MIIISAKGRLISANRLLDGVNDELYLQPYDRWLSFDNGRLPLSDTHATSRFSLPLFLCPISEELQQVVQLLAVLFR